MFIKNSILAFLFSFMLMPALVAQEKYFHELKGMEDSSGVTHLFYRIYESKSTTCSDFEGNSYNTNSESNHIYHFHTSTLTDSIKFRSQKNITPGCDYEWRDTERFIFTDNHPDSTFRITSILGGLYGGYYINITDTHDFSLNVGNPLGVSFDEKTDDIIITTPHRNLVIKAKNYHEHLLKKSFRYSPGDTAWYKYNHINELPDSLFIDFTVTGINPYKVGNYVGIKDSNIVRSTDHGNTFEVLLPHSWDEWKLLDEKLGRTYFDADSNSFYLAFTKNTEVYLVKNDNDAWRVSELSANYQSFQFALEWRKSGHFYFSDNDSLLHSTNFGEIASLVQTFPYHITGLYKKPDSDILYVLTNEELFEVNTESKQTTSLMKLPVSNEQEPTQIPKQAALHQNYPNPFNPSTVISYQLAVNSLVSLEVFDVTGRKVATLVDGEAKTAGNHQITFDADGLSSGMYFYRLQSGGKTFTQKMILLK